jgi:hypothetical protein
MTKGSDDWDDYNAERELAPEGPPDVLVHLALTCNGAWGLSIKDALEMRQHIDPPELPEGNSSWTHELRDIDKMFGGKVQEHASRIAWAAYRQGILHGELLQKSRQAPTI